MESVITNLTTQIQEKNFENIINLFSELKTKFSSFLIILERGKKDAQLLSEKLEINYLQKQYLQKKYLEKIKYSYNKASYDEYYSSDLFQSNIKIHKDLNESQYIVRNLEYAIIDLKKHQKEIEHCESYVNILFIKETNKLKLNQKFKDEIAIVMKELYYIQTEYNKIMQSYYNKHIKKYKEIVDATK